TFLPCCAISGPRRPCTACRDQETKKSLDQRKPLRREWRRLRRRRPQEQAETGILQARKRTICRIGSQATRQAAGRDRRYRKTAPRSEEFQRRRTVDVRERRQTQQKLRARTHRGPNARLAGQEERSGIQNRRTPRRSPQERHRVQRAALIPPRRVLRLLHLTSESGSRDKRQR